MKRFHALFSAMLILALLAPQAAMAYGPASLVKAVAPAANPAAKAVLAQVHQSANLAPNPQPTPGPSTQPSNRPPVAPRLPIVPLAPAEAHVAVATPVPASVSPITQEFTLAPGAAGSFQVVVNTNEAPIGKADLMFTFDLTGSMRDEIDGAKTSGLAIAQQIQAQLANSWFGVASFMDYPGDFVYPGYSNTYGSAADGDVPWRLDRNPSPSLTDFEAAVNSLVLGYGVDDPESYTRVLYELGQLPEIGWRKGAKKIVVLFGDAPTHDENFGGFNFGGDPGRNAAVGGGDDLDFETVVADLRTKQIAVIAIHSGETTASAATFQGMSIGAAGLAGTNGLYFLLENTTNLVSDVVNLVRTETQTVDELSLQVSPGYASWVNVTPALQTNVPANTTATFNVTVTPPAGTPAGIYAISIQTAGDGAILGTTTVYVTVPLTGAPVGFNYLPSNDGFGSATFVGQGTWPMFETFFGSEQVEYTSGNRIYVADQYFQNAYSVARDMSYGLAGLSLANKANLAPPPGASTAFALPSLNPLAASTSGGFTLDIRDRIIYGALTQLSVDGAANTSAFCGTYGKSPVQQYNYLKTLIETGTPAVVTLNYYTPTNSSTAAVVSLAPYSLTALAPPGNPNVRFVNVYDPYRPVSNNRRLRFDLAANTLRYEVALTSSNVVTVVAWSQIAGGTGASPVSPCQLSITPAEFLLRKGVPQWEVPIVRAAEVSAGAERPQVFVLKGSASLLVEDDSGRRFGFDGQSYRSEIPGAIVSSQSAPGSGEPLQYILPGGIQYKLWLIGTAAGKATLMTWLGSTYVQLADVATTPGSITQIDLARDGSTVGVSGVNGPTSATISINHLLFGEDRTATAGNVQVQGEQTVEMSYIVAPGAPGLAAASTAAVAAGDRVTITSVGGPPAPFNLSLQRSGEAGYNVFGAPGVVLDANSTQTFSITDWSNLGQVAIAVDEGRDGTVDKTVDAANASAPASVAVSAAPASIPVGGGETEVIVAVRDQFGAYAPDGTPVTLATTAGTLRAAGGATVGGLVKVKLASGQQAGPAVVSAAAGALQGQTTVLFTPGAPAAMTMAAVPGGGTGSLPADGKSVTTISARITDRFGNPVPGVPVNFTTNLGTIEAVAVTNANGEALVPLTSALQVGTAKITASSGSFVQTVNVLFVGSAIRGVVFADLNRNGVKDAGEPGLRGVSVSAKGKGSDARGAAVTAADGTYRIADLPLTGYAVAAAALPRLRFTTLATYDASVGSDEFVGANIGGIYGQYLPVVVRSQR